MLDLVSQRLLHHLEVELGLSLSLLRRRTLALGLLQHVIQDFDNSIHATLRLILVLRCRLQEGLQMCLVVVSNGHTVQQNSQRISNLGYGLGIDLGQPSHVLLNQSQGTRQRVDGLAQLRIPVHPIIVLGSANLCGALQILFGLRDGLRQLANLCFGLFDVRFRLLDAGCQLLLARLGVAQLMLQALRVVFAPLNELVVLAALFVPLFRDLGGQTSEELDNLRHRAAGDTGRRYAESGHSQNTHFENKRNLRVRCW
mmetsp:Transcript_47308/g.115927  ORF Transcript_47308/g.115927 Transcript_47308/m.115927 type:complete len:256 (+) Transcript_47308:906-1673(+)